MRKKTIRYFTLEELAHVITVSVEEASHLLGVGRSATYEAVHRGEIPCIRLGRSFRVLAKPLYMMLTGGQNASRTAK